MNKTINYLLVLALSAMLLTIVSIVLEISAESNRHLTKTNRVIVQQQTMLADQKKQLLLWNEERYSKLHSVPFHKSRSSFLNYGKVDLFYAGLGTLKQDSKFMMKMDFSNAINSNLENDVLNIIDEIDSFTSSYDPKEIESLDLVLYQKKFREMQSLLLSLNEIQRRWLKNRSVFEKIFSEKSISLSNASSYSIMVAFFLEVIIFIYIQFLEVRTERRRLDR